MQGFSSSTALGRETCSQVYKVPAAIELADLNLIDSSSGNVSTTRSTDTSLFLTATESDNQALHFKRGSHWVAQAR